MEGASVWSLGLGGRQKKRGRGKKKTLRFIRKENEAALFDTGAASMRWGADVLSWYSLCLLDLQLYCDYTVAAVPGRKGLSIQGQMTTDCQCVYRSSCVSASSTFNPVGFMPHFSLASRGGKNSLTDTSLKSQRARLNNVFDLSLRLSSTQFVDRWTRMKGLEVDGVRRNIKNELPKQERLI